MPDVLTSFIKDYLQALASVSFLTEDGLVCTKSYYRKLWAQIIKKLNVAVGSKDNLKLIPSPTAHILRHGQENTSVSEKLNKQYGSQNRIIEWW